MTLDSRRVVVIGSGPAGATAAHALVERGIPVTLLESGASFPNGRLVRAFSRNLYRKWPRPAEQYAHVASDDPEASALTALVPGGLSNYWTGAVPRFAPEDFFEGERLHERYRWPVGYDDLAQYYAYAERLLGVVGERRQVLQVSRPEVLVHARELGGAWRSIAQHADRFGQGLMYAPLADGPSWMLRRSGAGFNSFLALVSDLLRMPNFELRLGAHAQRLTWNAALGRVDGVEYVDRASGTAHHVAAYAVVVGAGPLASPKLLLQSVSRDFPSGLGNSRGVLGRYLHDHPHDWCVLEIDRPLPRLDQPLHLTREPFDQSPPLSAAQLTLGPLSKWDRLLSFTGATTRRFGVVTFGTMLPEERNTLGLHPEQRDAYGMPTLDLRIHYGDEVAPTVARSHERLLAILGSARIRARLECPMERLVPGSSAHYGGAVRMHDSANYGVLNQWNRLHDADNVAVVDASCFTTGVEKNPTLTVMALAARAADRLADDLRSGRIGRQQSAHAVPSLR
jgi:choline dehydrogenase-like flavoprotein